MNNNSNNFSCLFAESLVDYLYGECSAIEMALLENHISGCTECSHTLAEIEIAHAAIAEWKEIEFAPLATPSIGFLPEKSPRSTGILSNLRELVASWFPVPRLAAAGAGFVMLLAITGGFLIFSLRNGVNETAVFDSELDKNRVSIDQARESEQNRSEELASADAASVQVPPDLSNDGRDTREPRIEKNKQRATKRSVRKSPVQNETAVTISNSPGRESPRLNDFEDYHDNTLRLSEILDEIDSGK